MSSIRGEAREGGKPKPLKKKEKEGKRREAEEEKTRQTRRTTVQIDSFAK